MYCNGFTRTWRPWFKPRPRTDHGQLPRKRHSVGLLRTIHICRGEQVGFTWFREFRPIYGPFEAGLERFVKLDKPDFIGKAAALKEKAAGPQRTRVFMVVDATDSDVMGDEPIWVDGKVVGWVTSGGYGHHVDQSLAQGYIPTELVKPDMKMEIEILGERRPA
ncbi:MAG: aminomethyl transferase family protein, partial [Fibrella sp.]|nr:aminomethyl transferase family protein [Armatimonadota bacterium]